MKVYAKGKGIERMYLLEPETIQEARALGKMDRHEISSFATLWRLNNKPLIEVDEWPEELRQRVRKEDGS